MTELLRCPLIMDDSYQFPFVILLVEYQDQRLSIHTFILGIKPGKIIFKKLFPCIDIKSVIDDGSSIEFLIFIFLWSIHEIYIIDEFLEIGIDG